MRGSYETYQRDVLVSSSIDGWTDMVAGAAFVADNVAFLLGKVKEFFGGMFSAKKETVGMYATLDPRYQKSRDVRNS